MKIQYQRHRLETFEPSVLLDAVANTGFEHRLLQRGIFAATLSRVVLPNCQLDSGCYSLPCFCRGAAPKNWIMVGITFSSNKPAWVNGEDTHYDNCQLYSEGASIDYRTVSTAPWYTIQVPRDWLQCLAESSHGGKTAFPSNGYRNALIPKWSSQKLRQLMDFILSVEADDSILQVPSLAVAIEKQLIETLVDALASTSKRKVAQRKADQRRQTFTRTVEQYLEDHLREPFHLQEMLTHTGLQKRTLQRFCLEVYGLTPGQLFGAARLNRIRQELLKPRPQQTSVGETADAWGVKHLGRFAAQYFDLFGEYPRETLNRYA